TYDSWVLFTTEFYRVIQARLEPGGLFCQWIPFHGLSPAQYLSIVRTFSASFPHASLWVLGEAYSLLVATPQELKIDFRAMEKKPADNELARILRPVGLDDPYAVLSHFVMAGTKLRFLAGFGPWILTDDRPAHMFFPFRATNKEQYWVWPQVTHQRNMDQRESVVPYLTNLGDSKEERDRVIQVIRARERRR
ncbi:MAG: hypothetical protein V1742_10710, partial [Pseudomonadota bacterium]